MLPYQMLLHRKTREQLDINIKDSVIIIDEAHNLLDTIASIHSAEITVEQLQRAQQQLTAYKTKYLDRFSDKNLLRLNQLISIANRLAKFIMKPLPVDPKRSQNEPQTEFSSEMVLTHDLLDEKNISYGNIFELIKFAEETRLAQKVSGFALRYGNTDVIVQPVAVNPKKATHDDLPKALPLQEFLQKMAEEEKNRNKKRKAKPVENVAPSPPPKPVDNVNRLGSAAVIRVYLGFLETLLEKSTDGRLLLSRHRTIQSKSFIKYLLLNASDPFESIVKECRAVIVAGGTMQPTTEFTTQLFQKFQAQIEQHFYGHVVAADAILPMVVAKGPRNSTFQFNYANRGNLEMVSDFLSPYYFRFIF